MVFAVRCPNPKCRKYMLVEDESRDKTVPCLICKTAIRAGVGEPKKPDGPSSPKSVDE